ncbi:MAG: gliding motility-associated C-terminal domain-containing protein [Flavobacteriales bacterium]|nr:gliding motility-associated C-terminal domain-containing protein [Flavobacteriales bacterium]
MLMPQSPIERFALLVFISGVLFLTGIRTTSAQCTGSISLGNDTTLCTGQTIILSPGPGFLSYLWEDGSTAAAHTASTPGVYSCEVRELDLGGDLVVNGDFSAGAVGFTSGYQPGQGGSFGLLSLEGTYAVAANASATHNNFAGCTDHTGGGNMLVVNGAQTPGVSVWCQSITVVPGTDYAFNAWLTSVISENPAILQFTINGQVIGQQLEASPVTCTWTQFFTVWNSGAATTADICITNQNTQGSGNDFALDDISFTPFCVYSDTVEVAYVDYPDPDIGQDQLICGEGPVLLDATYPGATAYLWNDGTDSAQLEVTQSGTYWVHVFAASCMGRDSVTVTIAPQPVIDLGEDRALCTGDSVIIDAFQAGATYVWHDGSTGPTWTGYASVEAWVEVSNGPCVARDTVRVLVEDCGVEVVIPNVFSPNGDASNTAFTPILMKGVRSLSLEVFNRWGQQVFTSSNLNFAWNGRSGAGSNVPEGTYFWSLTFVANDGAVGERHGTVTLLR